MKKIAIGVLTVVVGLCCLLAGYAQNEWEAEGESSLKKGDIVVEGIVSEVNSDQAYIVVDDGTEKIKILTTQEVLEDAYLEIGDEVKVFGSQSQKGLELINFEYNY